MRLARLVQKLLRFLQGGNMPLAPFAKTAAKLLTEEAVKEVGKRALKQVANSKASASIERFRQKIDDFSRDSLVADNMSAGGSLGLGIGMGKGACFLLKAACDGIKFVAVKAGY
jgi:hypothetical protein